MWVKKFCPRFRRLMDSKCAANYLFKPFDFGGKFAVILLNCDDDPDKSWIGTVLDILWNRSEFNVCVDGGANVFCSLRPEMEPPILLSGDFDSIKEENLRFMREKNCVEIVETFDENENDFAKSLNLLAGPKFGTKISQIDAIYAIGGISSNRLDHAFGNFNTLFKARNLFKIPIYLMQRGSVTVFLPPGHHTIVVPILNTADRRGSLGRKCGLIPLGSSCRTCKTTGLKWNLEGETLKFGDLVSTSNEMTSAEVTIFCSDPLLWTMSFRIDLDLLNRS